MIRDGISDLGERTVDALTDARESIAFTGEIGVACYDAVRHPKKVRWGDTLYYMQTCGCEALPIVMLICFLVGLILAFQSAIPLEDFGQEMLVADCIALSVVKELGVLMVGIIAAGRAGSAFAAEIGTRKVSEEVNAMITMGLDPSRFLIVPKMIAMLLVTPMLTMYGIVSAIIGGMFIGVLYLGVPLMTYYTRTIDIVTPTHLMEGLIKAVVYSVLVTAAGCRQGFKAERDSQEVGRAATDAVVSGILLIIIADAILTVLFNI
jgi:phospholipid/cholesterol/gamma-HCH transport system permease protein